MRVLEDVTKDSRYAFRQIVRAPGFAIAAIGVLALGIGLNVAAFNLFNQLILRPLPVRDPDSLVSLSRVARESASDNVPYAAVAFYRDHGTVLKSAFGVSAVNLVVDNLESDGVRADFVTGNYFKEIGAEAVQGRLFAEQDDTNEAEPVVVLAYSFWNRRYGGDLSIVGRTIRLNSAAVRVVGVAAPGFKGVRSTEVDAWLPILALPLVQQNVDIEAVPMRLYGRLRPDLSIASTEAALRPLVDEFWKTQAQKGWEGEYLRVQSGAYAVLLGDQAIWFVAMGGTLMLSILVIACLTVGNMLLGRALSRDREISIRLALGARRSRLLRQLVTENLLLSLFGATAGLGLAWGSGKIAGYFAPGAAAQWAFDVRLVTFTLSIAILSTVVFGVLPAFKASRRKYRSGRLRIALVGVQIAMSCALLITAGFLVRGALRALSIDPGFGYRQLLVVSPGLAAHGYGPRDARQYLATLRSQLRSSPGVLSVAFATSPPFGGNVTMQRTARGIVWVNQVTADYLTTAGVRILRGRGPREDEPGVVVVSESLAKTFWPGEDAVGKLYGEGKQAVIGVASNATIVAPNRLDPMVVYQAIEFENYVWADLVIRTENGPRSSFDARGMAQNLDSRLSPTSYWCEERYRQRITESRQDASMIAGMGGLALLLALTGIYGFVNIYVSQRTRELGIRVALGSSSMEILRTVVGQLGWPVVVGGVAGCLGGFAAASILRQELYGISMFDPVTYSVSLGVFVVFASIVALIPARRALSVDPVIALRHE